MADRQVTATGKQDGNITSLCNSGASWSPRSSSAAISDIENGTHTYHVIWTGGKRTEVKVVQGSSGKYLRTDKDTTTKNNLDDLPNC